MSVSDVHAGVPAKVVHDTFDGVMKRYASSELSQPMISPRLRSNALFNASDCPPSGSLTQFSDGSAWSDRTISTLPSVEPPSTTMCSKMRIALAWRLSRASRPASGAG